MSNPFGFREMKRPRYYLYAPKRERYSRRLGVAVVVGVVAVAVIAWWSAKV